MTASWSLDSLSIRDPTPSEWSGALATPSTSLFNWVTSLASRARGGKRRPGRAGVAGREIASPAQLAGVHAGYTVVATPLSSSPLAAAVDAGAAEGVSVAVNVGTGVEVLVAADVGFAGDPHEASSAIAIIVRPRRFS